MILIDELEGDAESSSSSAVDLRNEEDDSTTMHALARSTKVGVAVARRIITASGSQHLEAQDVDGYTPLHVAVQCDNHVVVKELLDAGADKNASCGYVDVSCHRNPLGIAALEGSSRSLTLLLAAGVHPSASILDAGEHLPQTSPLHDACAMGALECAKQLLFAGASITSRTNWGAMPLHRCCSNPKSLDLVDLLLNFSLSTAGSTAVDNLINAEDQYGRTPFTVAAAERRITDVYLSDVRDVVVELFLSFSASRLPPL